MPIMPQIAMGFQPPQFQAPQTANTLALISQLENQRQENQLRQAQALKLQRDQERENALIQSMQGGKPLSWEQAVAGGKFGTDIYTAQQAELERRQKQMGDEQLTFAKVLYNIHDDPSLDSLAEGVRTLKARGLGKGIDPIAAEMMLMTPDERKQRVWQYIQTTPGMPEHINAIAKTQAETAKLGAETEKVTAEARKVGKPELPPEVRTAEWFLTASPEQQAALLKVFESKRAPGTTVTIDREHKPTPLQEAVDKKFAADYLEWQQGGGANIARNAAQISTVLDALKLGKPLTGPAIGIQPDLLLAVTNPQAVNARETVEQVAQQQLRAVLGAQFTQKEGEAFVKRVYNPALKPEVNAARLQAMFLQIQTAAAQKQAMVDYANEHGTLKGYKGAQPSINDFYEALDIKPPSNKSAASATTADVVRLTADNANELYDSLPSGAVYVDPQGITRRKK